MNPLPRPPHYLAILLILLLGVVAVGFFVKNDSLEPTYSPTPTASPSKSPVAKHGLSESDEILWSSFCDEVIKGDTRGIYYRNNVNADGNNWEVEQWCLTDSGTETMRLTSLEGVYGNIEQSFTPKTYVEEVYSKIISGSVTIKPKIDEPTDDDIGNFGFGSCSSGNHLTVNYGTKNFDGWILYLCGDPDMDLDDPKYFLTNLKGSYNTVFTEIAKIIPWSPTHLPKFSDFPAKIENSSTFAGHYEIKTWSCGTECLVGEIFDTKTSKSFGKIMSDGAEGFEFKKDSKLLIASRFNTKWSTFFDRQYYLWENDKFTLLYRTTVYYNDKYKFSFVAPPDWNINERPFLGDGRSLYSPSGECLLIAYVVRVNVDRETFDKFLNKYLTSPYDSQENITMAGRKGVKRTRASSVWAYTQSGENYYALGLACEERSQQQNYQVFEDALKTFEIED